MTNNIKTWIIILFLASGAFSQSLQNAYFSIHADNQELKEILLSVQQDYQLRFSWSPEIIRNKRVTIQFDSLRLDEGLNLLLDQVGLTYRYIHGSNTIVIYKPPAKRAYYYIYGYVTDKKNNKPLPGVNIIDSVSLKGTYTNQSGYYQLYLQESKAKIYFSHVGYSSRMINKRLTRSNNISVSLNEVPEQGETITIIADRDARWRKLASTGHIELEQSEIKFIPSLLGDADVGSTVQFSPGVQSGNDGNSGWFVRGGNPSQNLILLDGAPIYNSNHFYGFFSVFNPAAIKSITVLKSSFPAQYGGRISSVISVDMKRGDFYKFQGKVNAGFFASQFFISGPVFKNHSSFIISGRKSYMDFMARILSQGTMDVENYHFTDFYSKYSHILGKKLQFDIQYYKGTDFFQQDENSNKDNSHWGNTVFSGKLKYYPRKNIELLLNSGISNYEYINNSRENWDSDIYKSMYASAIKDLFSKAIFSYSPGSAFRFSTGFEYVKHSFKPGILKYEYQFDSTYNDAVQINQSLNSSEINFFVNNQISFYKNVVFNSGLRTSSFFYKGRKLINLNPRFLLSYTDSSKSIRFSYSKMSQNLHMVSSNGTGRPQDIWIPATTQAQPEISRQISIGINKRINKNIIFDMEMYYKKMSNLVEFKEGFNFIDVYDSWQKTIEKGKGQAYGLEFLLIRHFHNKTIRVIYNLSKSTRKFKNINYGKSFAYRYDRTHDIKFNFIWHFRHNWDISMNWFYATGMAVTIPTSQYNSVDGSILLDYQERNNYRIPPYHRMDISFRYHLKSSDFQGFNYSIGLFNLYNRRNPYYVYLLPSKNNKIEIRQLTIYPILPFFTLGYNF